MKRVLAVLLASALVFSLSMTVFAADSAEAENYATEIDDITEYVEEEAPALDDAETPVYYDITESSSFVYDGAAYIYAYIDGEWVLLVEGEDYTIDEDGVVTILVEADLVAVYEAAEEDTTAAEEDTTAAEDDTEEGTSDETGESSVMLYVAIAAIIAAAGLAVTGRKIRG